MVNHTRIQSVQSVLFLEYHPSSSNITRCQVPSRVRTWFHDSAGDIDFYQMSLSQSESPILHKSIIFMFIKLQNTFPKENEIKNVDLCKSDLRFTSLLQKNQHYVLSLLEETFTPQIKMLFFFKLQYRIRSNVVKYYPYYHRYSHPSKKQRVALHLRAE